ncbi:MAG: PspA/IM30 family protein [Thermoflexales bacterium]|nr:PspA/IM30 family protein [Thermoflexales bacterium]
MTKSLFKRIAGWLAIDPNDLWLDVADPEAKVRSLLAEMDSGLVQTKDAVAKAVVKEHQLAQRLARMAAAIAEWDAKADAALQAGDEKAARRALERKQPYRRAAQDIQASLDKQRQTVAEMKASLSLLQAKANEIRQRRDSP